MKCQKCEKPATFHITDLTGNELLALHLCPNCAKDYLQPEPEPDDTPTLSNIISKQLKIGQTAEELAALDEKKCEICGISFYEFRQGGRLGCPHDYVAFSEELESLLTNVHGHTVHTGKRPKRGVHDTQAQTEMIRLRREMQESVDREDYESATQLRDQIKSIEEQSTNFEEDNLA